MIAFMSTSCYRPLQMLSHPYALIATQSCYLNCYYLMIQSLRAQVRAAGFQCGPYACLTTRRERPNTPGYPYSSLQLLTNLGYDVPYPRLLDLLLCVLDGIANLEDISTSLAEIGSEAE
jgi:hypothetical protein